MHCQYLILFGNLVVPTFQANCGGFNKEIVLHSCDSIKAKQTYFQLFSFLTTCSLSKHLKDMWLVIGCWEGWGVDCRSLYWQYIKENRVWNHPNIKEQAISQSHFRTHIVEYLLETSSREGGCSSASYILISWQKKLLIVQFTHTHTYAHIVCTSPNFLQL